MPAAVDVTLALDLSELLTDDMMTKRMCLLCVFSSTFHVVKEHDRDSEPTMYVHSICSDVLKPVTCSRCSSGDIYSFCPVATLFVSIQ